MSQNFNKAANLNSNKLTKEPSLNFKFPSNKNNRTPNLNISYTSFTNNLSNRTAYFYINNKKNGHLKTRSEADLQYDYLPFANKISYTYKNLDGTNKKFHSQNCHYRGMTSTNDKHSRNNQNSSSTVDNTNQRTNFSITNEFLKNILLFGKINKFPNLKHISMEKPNQYQRFQKDLNNNYGNKINDIRDVSFAQMSLLLEIFLVTNYHYQVLS